MVSQMDTFIEKPFSAITLVCLRRVTAIEAAARIQQTSLTERKP